MQDYQAAEVEWYARHGGFPEHRIIKDGKGRPYVIGDWAWNRDDRPPEVIEPKMAWALRSISSLKR